MDIYLDLARRGKNAWWRYVAAVLLILCAWQILGSFPTILLLFWTLFTGHAQNIGQAASLPGVDLLVKFIAFMFASIMFLIGLFLAMQFIHRRSLRSLITPDRRLDWKRFTQGFLFWLLLAGITSILEAGLYPGRYSWSFDPVQFVPFTIVALVLIPIQTSTEELFFRGYILQGAGLRIRNIWVLSAISGILFGAPHLINPEASSNYLLMGLYYFAMGAFLAYLTLRDGRLELALGIHAANNLFSILIANTKFSTLPSPSLFTVNVLDPSFAVPAGLIGLAVVTWLCLGPFHRKKGATLALSPEEKDNPIQS